MTRNVFRLLVAGLLLMSLLPVIAQAQGCDPSVNYALQGNILYDTEDYAGAVAAYGCAIQTASNPAGVYNSRGNSYRQMGNYDQALADYTQALALDGDNAAILNNRGWAYYKLNQAELALADFDRAIEIDPNLAAAYNNRGLVIAGQGLLDDAVSDFDQAIDLGLDTEWATINRANIAPFASSFAGVDYDEVLQTGIDAYYSSDYPTAITAFTRAVEQNPEDYTTHWWLASSYYDAGEYGSSLEAANQALDLYDSDSSLIQLRGQIYTALGDYDLALADWDRVIEFNPKDPQAYSGRGYVHDLAENYDDAIADYTATIRLDPEACYAYNNRATIYTRLEDYEAALADYTSAIELDPTLNFPCPVPFYTGRGYVHYLMGNYEEALADYEQSLIYRPDNQWTLYDRMLTYIALEDFEGAAADFDDWIDLIQIERLNETLITVGETREIEMNEGWVYAIPFNAFAGEPLTLRVESRAGGPVVDPMIVVLDMDGAPIALDDDGGGGLAAQIAELNVPMDCEYTLIVTHAGAGSVGTVTVSITSAAVDV